MTGTEEVLGKCQLASSPWYHSSLCPHFLLHLGAMEERQWQQLLEAPAHLEEIKEARATAGETQVSSMRDLLSVRPRRKTHFTGPTWSSLL